MLGGDHRMHYLQLACALRCLLTGVNVQVSIMGAVRHPNIVLFMGLCLNPVSIVTEFCARGSLSDVLRKAAANKAFAQQMDWVKRLTMAMDAAKVSLCALFMKLYVQFCWPHMHCLQSLLALSSKSAHVLHKGTCRCTVTSVMSSCCGTKSFVHTQY